CMSAACRAERRRSAPLSLSPVRKPQAGEDDLVDDAVPDIRKRAVIGIYCPYANIFSMQLRVLAAQVVEDSRQLMSPWLGPDVQARRPQFDAVLILWDQRRH